MKHGIRLHKISNSDKVWSTCCALYKMLLFIYGLDKGWDEFSQDDSKLAFNVPFSMQMLNRHEENDEINKGAEYETGFFYKHATNDKRLVRKLPLHVF